GPDGGYLGSILAEIVEVGITPPVPAALRVDRARFGLGEEDYEPVRIGDLGVARFLDELVAHRLARLLATVECDMDAAAPLRRAGRGDIDHALVGEAVASPGAGLLVGHDELASRFRGVILERAIDPVEDGLWLIVVAVADIGLGRDATGCSALLGAESVAALLLHQVDVRLRHADLL